MITIYYGRKKSRTAVLQIRLSDHKEIKQHEDAQNDPIPSEHLEIMLLDVAHEETDDQDRYDEGHQHADQQQHQFCRGKGKAESDQSQQACAKHDGDSEEKGKFCGYRAADSDHQRTDDRRTGTRGTRKHGSDELKHADDQRVGP